MPQEACPIDQVEKLLLSTDGSEFSAGAIRGAITLARRCSSKLMALDVIETNEELSALASDYVEKMEAQAREHLQAIAAQAEQAGLALEPLTHEGVEPFQAIVDEAKKQQADMIVMGRRGRSGIKRLLMGSVTARVIGHAPCDVLVVPKDAELKFNLVLVAVDGSTCSETAAREAVEIAQKCNCSLLVISVAAADVDLARAEECVGRAVAVAEAAGVRAEKQVVTGQPDEAIVATAKAKGADLIVVGSHGRTGMKRLLLGSIAERVIGHADCAVLVAKEAA